MQLWQTVNGFLQQTRATILRRQVVHRAVLIIGQPPCTAQIHHANAAFARLRHHFPTALMGSGEKEHVGLLRGLPGERHERRRVT